MSRISGPVEDPPDAGTSGPVGIDPSGPGPSGPGTIDLGDFTAEPPTGRPNDPGGGGRDRDRTNTSTRPNKDRPDPAGMDTGQGFNPSTGQRGPFKDKAAKEQEKRSGVRATDASTADNTGAPAGNKDGSARTDATVAGSVNFGLTEIAVLAGIVFAYVQLT